MIPRCWCCSRCSRGARSSIGLGSHRPRVRRSRRPQNHPGWRPPLSPPPARPALGPGRHAYRAGDRGALRRGRRPEPAGGSPADTPGLRLRDVERGVGPGPLRRRHRHAVTLTVGRRRLERSSLAHALGEIAATDTRGPEVRRERRGEAGPGFSHARRVPAPSIRPSGRRRSRRSRGNGWTSSTCGAPVVVASSE